MIEQPLLLEDGFIICPICGSNTIDRRGRVPDHEAVTVHPDRDGYDSPVDTRGGYLQIDLQCFSCEARLALIVANHKGMERLALVMPTEL